jgi:hypothetical protein
MLYKPRRLPMLSPALISPRSPWHGFFVSASERCAPLGAKWCQWDRSDLAQVVAVRQDGEGFGCARSITSFWKVQREGC